MVRTFLVAMLLCPILHAQTSPPPYGVKPDYGPQALATFGGLRPGDTIVDRWTVRDITVKGREIFVTMAEAKEPLMIVFSMEKGDPGAFDAEGVRIYYENAPLPQATILKVGKAMTRRAVSFASQHGGLKSYITNVMAQGSKTRPEQSVNREIARNFLDQLSGKWTVTLLQWVAGAAVPRTIGTGTSERRRFLNDLLLREDTTGPGKSAQFMTVGCNPDVGRCWLFVLDDTSSNFIGGWCSFNQSENALRVIDTRTTAPVVVLRIVDRNRSLLEFYAPGISGRLVKTMRYERAK
jgi:hypothetical protein